MKTGIAQSGLSFPGPLAPFLVAWRNRDLIRRLTQREIEARYRGSILGLGWGFLLPLGMLTVYTFVFSTIFQARWATPSGSRAEFALVLFSGLLIYGVFAEAVNRAPTLIQENISYVKKVVFPLEILAWVNVASSLVSFLMGFGIFLVAHILVHGAPTRFLPFIALMMFPLILITVGATWFLSSLGVFLRDTRQIVAIGTTMLLFVSPVLYPTEAVPSDLRWILFINPLAPILEVSKDILFFDGNPDWSRAAGMTLFGWAVAWLGFAWFIRTKRAFADVL